MEPTRVVEAGPHFSPVVKFGVCLIGDMKGAEGLAAIAFAFRIADDDALCRLTHFDF